MKRLILLLLVTVLAPPALACEGKLTDAHRRLVDLLVARRFLSADEVPGVSVLDVEIHLTGPSVAWSIESDFPRRVPPMNDHPGALITKASGHQMVIIDPVVRPSELLPVRGERAAVRVHRITLLTFHPDGGVTPHAPSRVGVKGPPGATAYQASRDGRPVLAWQLGPDLGRWQLTTREDAPLDLRIYDRVELWDGRRVMEGPSRTLVLPPSVRARALAWEANLPGARDLLIKAHRWLDHHDWESALPPLDEIGGARTTTAVVASGDGAGTLDALVGPEHDGLHWVMLFERPHFVPFWPSRGEKHPEITLADGRRVSRAGGFWVIRRDDDGAMVDAPAPRRKPGPHGAAEAVPAPEKDLVTIPKG